MQRPKMEVGHKSRHHTSEEPQGQLSFKAAWNNEEESIINRYELGKDKSPQVQKYPSKPTGQSLEAIKPKQAKISPFA